MSVWNNKIVEIFRRPLYFAMAFRYAVGKYIIRLAGELKKRYRFIKCNLNCINVVRMILPEMNKLIL